MSLGADLSDAAIARLKADIERTAANLLRWLRDQSRGTLEADFASLAARDMSRVLGELGFNDAAMRVIDAFEAVASATTAQLRLGPTSAFSTVSLESLRPFVGDVANTLIATRESAAEEARKVLVEMAAAGKPPEDAFAAVAEAARLTLRKVIVAIATSLFAFHRFTLLEQAEDAGIDLFRYGGPDDDVTRPFCVRHVDRVYTRGDLDREDNGHGLKPTSAFLGGYNCRHRLEPISITAAQALPAAAIGGPEARRILQRGTGPNERGFIARNRGVVVGGTVVRR